LYWMGIPLKNRRASERLRAAGRIVAETFALLGEHVKPGITLRELDQLAQDYLKKQRAAPLYKGYRGNPPEHPPFPGVICASVNNEICHGLPDERVLREGDIVGIDIGLRYKGYCGDACVTFGVGQISAEAQRLLDITQTCLRLGIEAAQPGNRMPIGRELGWCASGAGTAWAKLCTNRRQCHTSARRSGGLNCVRGWFSPSSR
jgi:methionyl aminopeptidase